MNRLAIEMESLARFRKLCCLWKHCPMTSWSTATPNLRLSPVWDLLTQQRERNCGNRFSPAVHLSCRRGRLCMERLTGSVKVENIDIHFWAWYLDITCSWGGRNRKFHISFIVLMGHPILHVWNSSDDFILLMLLFCRRGSLWRTYCQLSWG